MLGLHCCSGSSLVVVSGANSLVLVRGLLIVVASLVAEHRLQGMPASVVVIHGLQSTGSIAVVHRLSCTMAGGIFPDQGSNQCPLHCKADSSALDYQGRPAELLLFMGMSNC